MKIREVYQQTRRDFLAVYVCESCGYVKTGTGYDDKNFHENVLPGMICPYCKQKSPDSYVPRATKYPEGMHV